MQTIIIKNEQSKRYCEDIISEIPLDGSHTVIREFPRKPRPLAARMNWQNNLKIT
jgi:hypothetical protein